MADDYDHDDERVWTIRRFPDREFKLIRGMVEEAILFDHVNYRDIGTELEPAEALDAIRRGDLSSFDWMPKDDATMRTFLSRYAPLSVLQYVIEFNHEDLQGFMDAWMDDSAWNPLLKRLLEHASLGAAKAYKAILAGKSVPLERGKFRKRKMDGQAHPGAARGAELSSAPKTRGRASTGYRRAAGTTVH